jgi:hypothetical protein
MPTLAVGMLRSEGCCLFCCRQWIASLAGGGTLSRGAFAMLEKCPICGVRVWFTDDVCPHCRSHCPTRLAAPLIAEEDQPTTESAEEGLLGNARPERPFLPWICGAIGGGIAGIAFGGNLVLTFAEPGMELPRTTIWICLGIASLAGLILTPVFRSDHPVAVNIQGAVLGLAIGSITATFPVALGVEYPRLAGFPARGPTILPMLRFMIMAANGTVGGIVLGSIGWPILRRLWKKQSGKP